MQAMRCFCETKQKRYALGADMAVRGRMVAWAMLIVLVLASGAGAQGVTDPGDLAFWQSIQSSKSAGEYGAYLQSYPNGRFAELARLRIQQLGGDTQTPGPRPVPVPVPVPDAGPDPSIRIAPPGGRVGQRFNVTCVNFPQENSYDKLVIVPAGTPVVDPAENRERSGVLWSTYGSSCGNAGTEAGPFAPGAYEVRWMSTLYNNDRPARYELKAMTAFTVR